MKIKNNLFFTFICMLGCTLFLWVSNSTNANAADSLWVTQSKNILKVTTSDGHVLFKINHAKDIRAIASDGNSETLWTFGNRHLRAYGKQGELLVETVLPHKSKFQLQGFVVDSETVWLALGKTLYVLDKQGTLLHKLSLSGPIKALTLDRLRGQVWLVIKKGIMAIDRNGEIISRIELDQSHNDVDHDEDDDSDADNDDDDSNENEDNDDDDEDRNHHNHDNDDKRSTHLIVYDNSLDQLWVIRHSTIDRYNADGQHIFRSQKNRFFLIKQLVVDGNGGLWLSSRNRIAHINVHGETEFIFKPFAGKTRSRIIDLSADNEAHSIWITNGLAIKQYDISGALQTDIGLDLGHGKTRWIRHIQIQQDIIKAPQISITAPLQNALLNDPGPLIELSIENEGTLDSNSFAVTVNGETVEISCTAYQGGAECSPLADLPQGYQALAISVANTNGDISNTAEVDFTIDSIAPIITIVNPSDNLLTANLVVNVSGQLNEAVQSLTLNLADVSNLIAIGNDKQFSHDFTLIEGDNVFTLTAVDLADNFTTVSQTIIVDSLAPFTPDIQFITVSEPINEQITVTGQNNSVEPNSQVTIINNITGEKITVTADDQGAFVATIVGQVGHTIQIISADEAGNNSDQLDLFVVDLPTDPVAVAPPLSQAGVAPFSKAIAFLYTGNDPIQTGVAAETITFARAAVVRGLVLNKQNQPLPGVTITVKDHPEFGQTLSRTDGMFDMAVNGGGILTINYEKPGFLPVQRQVRVPWKNYQFADDVVMIALDPQVTRINANSQVIQVAQGTPQVDEDGSRQATLLFPAGTTGAMVLPDGTEQALTSMNVRATEYTVGDNGPETMPGELPPTSAYTYAVELSVDEAIAVNATRVQFNQPVALYVDNFLNFPVGEIVPVGFYDREKTAWIPSDNGRVISILSIENNQAVVDVLGEKNPATQEELDELGIRQAELQQLANLYSVGKSLWRSPIPHFSPWDSNWPYGPPNGASAPGGGAPSSGASQNGGGDTSDQNCQSGCIIEAQGQVLREDIPITGTPYSLHYRSDRVPDHTAKNSITIPISEPSPLPDSLISISVEVYIAGRRMKRDYAPVSGLQDVFEWDGFDTFGREVYGTLNATVSVTYTYPCVYYAPGFALRKAFAQFSSQPADPKRLNLTSGIGTREGCSAIKNSNIWQVFVESPLSPSTSNTGDGWSITPLHRYSIAESKVHKGDGTVSHATRVRDTLKRFAGIGRAGYSGDGESALQASFRDIAGITFGADGSLFIADQSNNRIRRINPLGIVSTYAGNGTVEFSGDGGPAVEAGLYAPKHLAYGSDGSLFVVGVNRIRRIDRDGIITTVAGNGIAGFSGDDGLAINANINTPAEIVVALDGGFYFADRDNARVRYVSPAGVITTIAGNGEQCLPAEDCGDDGPALEASFLRPVGLTLDSKSNLYIGDTERHEVLRVGADGIITKVAGIRIAGNDGDGGPAINAQLNLPAHLAVNGNDDLIIANAHSIRIISGKGIITSVIGTGETELDELRSDDIPAQAARASDTRGLAIHPQQILFFSTLGNRSVENNTVSLINRLIVPSATSEIFVAGREGSELYVFNSFGVHLRTQNAITNEMLSEFGYDGNGRLIRIIDLDGDVTTIERDSTGKALAIISADGKRTGLLIDSNEHLTQVMNPADEQYAMRYTSDGLLTEFHDRKGNVNTFEYDLSGRLIRDVNAGNGGWTLQRKSFDDGFETTMISAEGREYHTSVEHYYGHRYQISTRPDGSVQTQGFSKNGRERTVLPDGTIMVLEKGPDPRFGMQAPVIKSSTVTTPGGLSSIATIQRETKIVGDSLFDLVSQTDTTFVNGKISKTVYDAATKTYTSVSPENRVVTHVINSNSRPIRSQITGLEAVNFEYDERGRLITISEGQGDNTRTTQLSYHQSGFQTGYLQSITDALNHSVSFTYDEVGRIIKQTLPDNRIVEYAYDANDNLISLKPPGRLPYLFNYNTFDKEAGYIPPVVVGSQEHETAYDYNLDKELIRITRPDSQQILFNYNDKGQLTDIETPSGSFTYTYGTPNGKLIGISDPQGGSLTFDYDGFLLTSSAWTGDVSGQVTQDYNNDFLIRQRCVNNVSCVGFQYDNDNLFLGTDVLFLSRDSQRGGLVTSTVLGDVATEHTYNEFGELVAEMVTENRLSNSGIYQELNDQSNDLEAEILASIIRDFGPNSYLIAYVQEWFVTIHQLIDGLPETQSDLGRELSNLRNFLIESGVFLGYIGTCVNNCGAEGEDCACDELCIELGDCCSDYQAVCVPESTDPVELNVRQQLDAMTALNDSIDPGNVSEEPFYHVVYQRDKLGRITEKTEVIDSITTIESYGYDTANRLKTVIRDGLPTTYSYDANGNRLSKVTNNSMIAGVYDDQDRLLSYGDCNYSYTDNGELTSKICNGEVTRYTYDVMGNLLSVIMPDNTNIEYVIDGQNRRVGKRINGILVQGFLYADQLNPIAELDSENQIISRFVYSSKVNVPDYMIKSNVIYRIISDHLGSPRMVVNSDTGEIVQRIDYDVFGSVIQDTNPGFQPFGFAGGLYEQGTQLTRFGARDYDATIGRWTNKDPIGFSAEFNLYGYATQDPVNFIDIHGLACFTPGQIEAIAAGIGGAVGGGVSGVVAGAALGGVPGAIVMGIAGAARGAGTAVISTIAARQAGNIAGGSAAAYGTANGGAQSRAGGAVGQAVSSVIGNAGDSAGGAIAGGALGGAISGDGFISGALGGLAAYGTSKILTGINDCPEDCK